MTFNNKKLIFGTYRLKPEILDIAIDQALNQIINFDDEPMLDTAVIYNNSDSIKTALSKFPNLKIGTKIKSTSNQ